MDLKNKYKKSQKFLILLLALLNSVSIIAQSKDTEFFRKIYGIDGFKYECTCTISTKKGADIVKVSFLDIQRKEMVVTEFDYYSKYATYYQFLLDVGKKSREWQIVALNNNVEKLHKEIPVYSPIMTTVVMDLSGMAMGTTSPKVEFGMTNGHSSAYVSFGYIVSDNILGTNKAFGLFLPIDDFGNLIDALQPENMKRAIKLHHTPQNNADDLFQ